MQRDSSSSALALYNRASRLLRRLKRQTAIGSQTIGQARRAERMAAREYNDLRHEAVLCIPDPGLTEQVRPIANLDYIRLHVGLPVWVAILVLPLVPLAGFAIWPQLASSEWSSMALISPVFGYMWLLMWDAHRTPSTAGTRQLTNVLREEIIEHLRVCAPDVAAQHWPTEGEAQRLRARAESAESEINERLDDLDRLQGDLTAKDCEISRLIGMLNAVSAPEAFPIDESVLCKLDARDRQRLTEAVLAFRVRAWTPAAAMCGMLLEGRLQQLCVRHNLPRRGIPAMIEMLAHEGLLKGHHEQLARVASFFRNRSAHPTTEEFDREKTSLVLTSLVLLIRDVF